MDDLVVLTRARWQLRRAVRTLNQVFNALRVEQHPGKTFIGRIARGFDFLGCHFGAGVLKIAAKTISNRLIYPQEKWVLPDLRIGKATRSPA